MDFGTKYQFKVESESIHDSALAKRKSNNTSIHYRFGDYGEEIIDRIASKLGNSLVPRYNKTGVTFFGYKGRILKIVKKQKNLEIEFNAPVTKVPGVVVLSDKEARDNYEYIYRYEF